ncbi:MAG: fructose-6-phosphate aldolase [Victivallales bacterium]|nr:fructose-6-phosphate aldolase [Victivallales bacterium]
MKFFIDSADVKEIQKAVSLGVIDGVTTNPTHMAKAVKNTGKKPEEVLREICSLIDGPISAEALSLESGAMIEEARQLASIHPNIVIKLPITEEALKAVNVLSKEGIKTNVTLIFSPAQALMAAKAGASYVSPFVARLDRVGQIGIEIVSEIVTIFRNYQMQTEVIVASLTNPRWVVDAAVLGADIATIPYDTFDFLVKHPMTDIGIEQFMNDWKNATAK